MQSASFSDATNPALHVMLQECPLDTGKEQAWNTPLLMAGADWQRASMQVAPV
jgi:hypothetical protein